LTLTLTLTRLEARSRVGTVKVKVNDKVDRIGIASDPVNRRTG